MISMTIVWLLLLLVPLFLYLVLMDIRANREKNERKEMSKHLKQEAAGDPDKLRCIEIHEIEVNLIDKITDKMHRILSDEVSDDLYAGAFKDYKPDIKELTECVMEHGYQPDIFDDKVLNILTELSRDPDLAFLLNHGICKEAELRHQLKLKTKELDKEK